MRNEVEPKTVTLFVDAKYFHTIDITNRYHRMHLLLKANMNSYIQLQTAAIFFLSSLYLKQGIDSVYVMVGFICKG